MHDSTYDWFIIWYEAITRDRCDSTLNFDPWHGRWREVIHTCYKDLQFALETKGSKSAGNVRVKGTKISLIFIALLYLASLLSVYKYNQLCQYQPKN